MLSMQHTYKKPLMAYLLLFMQFIAIIIFFLWPAFNALYEAFFYTDAFSVQHKFAGLYNFKYVLTDPTYISAILVTLILSIGITTFSIGAGLILALSINKVNYARNFYKTIILFTYAIAPAVAAILWRFLMHPTIGWVATLLHYIGIDFNYFMNSKYALIVIILAASWQQLSYNFLFFYTAIINIPNSILEAAVLDGGSSWHRFWHIVLPLLSPTMFFLLTMNIIYSLFDTFGIIQILTNGGPGHNTTNLVYKIYQDGWIGLNFGSSAAQSVLLMFFVLGIVLLQFRFLEKKVHYQ